MYILLFTSTNVHVQQMKFHLYVFVNTKYPLQQNSSLKKGITVTLFLTNLGIVQIT